MSFDAPQPTAINGTPFSVGIVAARYNGQLVGALLGQVVAGLEAAGVKTRRIKVIRVPGANELPSGAQLLLRKQKALDVVVALGVIIRGDTIHYELVAETASQGLQRVALDARIPVITGVVVAENAAQAEDRCLGQINRGAEFARAALEMAALKKEFST
ncbi:6,7-dimethyl-8-ribityllumazine synthase [Opitutaceae bacterium]